MRIKTFETSPEKRMRRVLSFAVEGTHYWVNSQTPIEAVVEAGRSDPDDERSLIRNGSFDFTIHKESTPSALWVVEYDGPTHDEPDRVGADIRKNRICGKLNLPLLRIGYREDDDFLTAAERLTPLEWLVRRWIAYESKIDGLTRRSEDWVTSLPPAQRATLTFEEVNPEFHFDLDHPYPPLAKISDRLLEQYAIDVELCPISRDESPTSARWRATVPWGGPLQDLDIGGFHIGHSCEVQVHPTNKSTGDTVFVGRGAFSAKWAYPVYHGQRSPFDLRHPVLSGPPWGGSPARIGGEIAHYRALRQIEQWAERNLASCSRRT